MNYSYDCHDSSDELDRPCMSCSFPDAPLRFLVASSLSLAFVPSLAIRSLAHALHLDRPCMSYSSLDAPLRFLVVSQLVIGFLFANAHDWNLDRTCMGPSSTHALRRF